MTPHIKAKKEDFAKVVLMPGDPLRAKWIAENFLVDAKLVNEVRNMYAYTGYYKNKKVSVMAHGMGNPSVGIYSYELFSPKFFDVSTIIRIGSCGSLNPNIRVKDVIIAESTFSESVYAQLVGAKETGNVLHASKNLVELAKTTAKALNLKATPTQAYASDVFYGKETYQETVQRTKSDVVEMESYALYANADVNNKQALCLLTVSDSLVTHESMPAEDRQTTFKDMVTLALEMAVKLA